MIEALVLAAIFQLPPQSGDAVIGVSAIHVESGRTLSMRGTERFPMASVYKVPIGIAVLRRIDIGELSLSQRVTIERKDFSPGWSPLRETVKGESVTLTVADVLRRGVAIGDNTAADALMRLAGGPHGVSTRMAELGFAGIRVDRPEKEIFADVQGPNGNENYRVDARDTSSPDDMARLLLAVWQGRAGLSKESRALLIELMMKTVTGARRIKAGVPPGSTVAHRTGTVAGTANDVAIVTSPDGANHVVIVVFTKGGAAPLQRREDDIAAVARKAYAELLKPAP